MKVNPASTDPVLDFMSRTLCAIGFFTGGIEAANYTDSTNMKHLLLLFFLWPALQCRADAVFDSVYVQSEMIVYGQVIRHEISPFQFDFGTKQCTMDIVINSVCTGGKPVKDLVKFPEPGDTIRNVDYLGGEDADTLVISKYYIFPLISNGSSWNLTDEDYHYGVFSDYSLLKVHCPIIYIEDSNRQNQESIKEVTSAKNGWTIVKQYYSNDTLKRVTQRKPFARKIIRKEKEYDQQGRLLEKTRMKTTHGVHQVTWTFRSNGHRCLRRRSVWIID